MSAGRVRMPRLLLSVVAAMSSAACGNQSPFNPFYGPAYKFSFGSHGGGGVSLLGTPAICTNPAACGPYDGVIPGTVFNLSPIPAPGWHFTGWLNGDVSTHVIVATGPCSGTANPYAFAVNANGECIANFAPDTPVALTIIVNGSGAGTVETKDFPWIFTAQTLTENVASGETIALIAKPNGTATINWLGCDGGTAPFECTVDMTGPRTVTANFGPALSHTLLSIYVTGSGLVRNDSYGGRTCASNCGYTNVTGATVFLTAVPDPFWSFSSWSGACAGTAPSTSVVMSTDKTCTANFVLTNPVRLVVAPTGGAITSGVAVITGPGISCGTAGTDCDQDYGAGQIITLLAAAPSISWVDGWTNCTPSSDRSTCAVTMDASKTVDVSVKMRPRIIVNANPQGRITSTDGTFNCTGTCEVWYVPIQQITLDAVPLPGWHFDSWTGCPNPPSAGQCIFSVAADAYANVTANFVKDPVVGVQVAVEGSGTVTGGGLNCGSGGSACLVTAPAGTVVWLKAVPDAVNYFDHWSGDCFGIATDTPATSGPDVTCTAVFGSGAGPDRPLVATGWGHSCAIKASGRVMCWGAGAPRGDGSPAGTMFPEYVNMITGLDHGIAVAIVAGEVHTCALMADQSVLCWGGNGSGQIGDGTFVTALEPVTVPGISNAIAIGAGPRHTCAVRATGQAQCWGDNTWGQLGNASTSGLPEANPVWVVRSGGLVATGMGGVQGSGLATCAQGSDHSWIECWGTDSNGEFGNGSLPGTTSPSATTANVRDRHNPFRLATGGANHGTSCVIESNGNYVFCWGQGTSGQLGNGATASANIPVAVSVINGVNAITMGSAHACAYPWNGEVRCWGAGGVGQLGDNTILDASTPQRVYLPLNQSVAAMGSGPASDHTCFLGVDGSAWCWGRGSQGQLGDGVGYSSYLQSVPVRVIGF